MVSPYTVQVSAEAPPRFLSNLLWPFVSKRDQGLSSKAGMEISEMEAISEGS